MDIRELVDPLAVAENVDYDAWEVLHSWLAEHRVDLARVYHGGDPPYPSVATVDERIRRFCRWLQTQDLHIGSAQVADTPAPILCELRELRAYLVRAIPSAQTQDLHYVYRLIESDTNAIRYVGRTTEPHDRLRNHWRGRCSKSVQSWLRGLKERGATARMQILAFTPNPTDADTLEKSAIRDALLAGHPILNMV